MSQTYLWKGPLYKTKKEIKSYPKLPPSSKQECDDKNKA